MSDTRQPDGPVKADDFVCGDRGYSVTVDPTQTNASFVMGVETLQPKAAEPVHRYLNHERVVFIHKGQGRAVIGTRQTGLVPGEVVIVPRGIWHRIVNTGTGLLRLVWVMAPGGIEGYYRELSQLGPSATEETKGELAQRFGVEMGQASAAETEVSAGPDRHRRRRRRRGGAFGRSGREGRPGEQPRPEPVATAGPLTEDASEQRPEVQPVQQQPVQPAGDPAGTRRESRRDRRPRGRRRGEPRPNRDKNRSGRGPVGQGAEPQGAQPQSGDSRGGHAHGPAREVYMNGRWVTVSGPGPVIAGPTRRGHSRPRPQRRSENFEGGRSSAPPAQKPQSSEPTSQSPAA